MTKRFDDEFVRRGNQADSMTLGGLNDNAVKLGAGQNKKYTFRLTPASACDTVRVTVDDPTVAKAEIGTYAGTFVVTGVQNGETTLTVRAGTASATVNVIIDDEARNGWYEENGKHYWYVDGERQGLQKGGLEFTDPDTGCRYWLDPDDSGARAENRKVQLDEDRLCYFDENGCMAFGECLEHGGWYYYDEKTGAQCRGPVVLPDGRQVFYSLTNGKMLYGKQTICGTSFTFNTVNGSRSSGPDGLFWLEWGGKRYWFESWKRQGYNPYDSSYRGKEIYDPASNGWYWLDNVQQGAKTVSKDVYQESEAGDWAENADGTGKWVRYDANGHMVKGWDTNNDGTYYFDQVYGTMAKGIVTIDGNLYLFDVDTGVMQASITASEEAMADRVIELVNQERTSRGLQPLLKHDGLMVAAAARARELSQRYSHTRPDGSECFTILWHLGIDYGYAGENIAMGQRTPEIVMNDWMNSSGHRANILSENFDYIGVGYTMVDGHPYWVQLFTGDFDW